MDSLGRLRVDHPEWASWLGRAVSLLREDDATASNRAWVTFTFRFEETEGTPADTPGVYLRNPGDTIHPVAGRTLGVVGVRNQGDDEPTVLVVENVSE
jgi:hypothetical protein